MDKEMQGTFQFRSGVVVKNYRLISSNNISEFIAEINQHEIVSFDTETTGLNVRKEKVIGFSVSCIEGTGWYLPTYIWNKRQERLERQEWALSIAPDLLSRLKTKKLIMHNASFDIRVVANFFGISLISALHADTQLMKHTLWEEGPFGLKENAIIYDKEIGLDSQDAANQEQLELEQNVLANGGKWKKSQKDMYKADLDILAKYAIADTDITLRLFNYFDCQLVEQGLYDFFYQDEVMPLYKLVTIKMEHRGVYLDMASLTKYNAEIEQELAKTEELVVNALMATPEGQKFVEVLLEEEFPIVPKGKVAQKFCEKLSLPLPKLASGNYQLNKKTLDSLVGCPAKEFLQTGETLTFPSYFWQELRMDLLKETQKYPINIGSKDQLGKLVFEYMGIEPLTKTPSGKGQFNEDFVEHLAEKYGFAWAKELRVYNKLTKIKSSYYDRFIELQEDGIYYPTFKQHATTSGRFGSDFQQLPRPKEEDETESEDSRVVYFTNTIRKLVIPKPSYVFIDDDYESLEPRVFADDAGDQSLIDIFLRGEDFYSKIGIGAEKLEGVSADKKASNFLKKVNPLARQMAKAYALGIRYGMKNVKLSYTLNISKEEAQKIIDNYFDSFPGLKNAMDGYLHQVKTTGTVASKFGRVRHLPRAREIYRKYGDSILDYRALGRLSFKHKVPMEELKTIRKEYNNLLNNALNFPIQSASASLVNRAAISMAKSFLAEGLDAWVSLQVHDQLVISCNENCIDRVKEVVQDAMENTNKLAMPLIAKPEVARNLRDGH
jgi:DNA polymerase I-like protein with 3'-5' exonuclease and polymerase domains